MYVKYVRVYVLLYFVYVLRIYVCYVTFLGYDVNCSWSQLCYKLRCVLFG
jgi:hypothetical protein